MTYQSDRDRAAVHLEERKVRGAPYNFSVPDLSDDLYGLSCETCGAQVPDSRQELHYNWHIQREDL